jgi:hypothetical protein
MAVYEQATKESWHTTFAYWLISAYNNERPIKVIRASLKGTLLFARKTHWHANKCNQRKKRTTFKFNRLDTSKYALYRP